MALRVAGGGSGGSGVQTVTAGTNVTLGGTAQNPVINSLGGSTPPTPTTFTTTISLANASNGLDMGVVQYRAASTFSSTGNVDNGTCTFVLIGDGNPAHIPTFPTAWGNPNNYTFNTTAGASNQYAVLSMPSTGGVAGVNLFGNGGPFYGVIASAQVLNAAPTQIVVTLDSNVVGPLPANTAWTGSGSTAGAFTVSASSSATNIVTLTTNKTFVFGETITLTYAQPGTNNLTSSTTVVLPVTALAVTNNVLQTAALSKVIGAVPGSAIDTSVTALNNWRVPQTSSISTNAMKNVPAFGDITWTDFGGGSLFIAGPPGWNGVTCTAGDNRAGVALTASVVGHGQNAPAAGTAYGNVVVIPVTTASRTIDLYFKTATNVTTISMVLADGSATTAPFVVTNSGTTQRLTITCVAGSATTLTITLSNANVSGTDFLYTIGAFVS